MAHALVLNASFEPLQFVTWQRALQLVFQGKVEIVEESDQEVRTVRLTFKVPSVLRLLTYVPLKKKKNLVRFSRANVFTRDHNTCQYCAKILSRSSLTLDHVIPIVQGGGKTWENIVTACKPCNQRKGGRTPLEASMALIRRPRCPNFLPGATLKLNATFSVPLQSWKVYFSEDPDDPGQEP
jgi:5-methylcytosine-specific restriction endonuclease McrA